MNPMRISLSAALLSCVLFSFLLALVPLFTFAQTNDAAMEAQIRAALEQEAAQEGMSEEEFSALVKELSAQAKQEGVSQDDIQPSYAPEQTEFGGDVTDAYAESDTSSASTLPVAIGILLVLALLFALWRKMEAGGAVGAARVGNTQTPSAPVPVQPPFSGQ